MCFGCKVGDDEVVVGGGTLAGTGGSGGGSGTRKGQIQNLEINVLVTSRF